MRERGPYSRSYELSKRCIDVGLSTAALLSLAPVMLGVATAIWLSDGRPLLFRQRRPGQAARPFEVLKFRTMRAAKPGEPEVASDGSRVTRLGRFLRATSLDELPTLWNVVRGEMSLVGPRPLLMQYLERYTARQARRHEVKPGVTGWAQINGRNAIEWDAKLELDVWYVEHASLGLDLRILAATIGKVLAREGVSRGGHETTPEFEGSARTTRTTGSKR